jgi:O-antigen/teichoic acid export membrane protein
MTTTTTQNAASPLPLPARLIMRYRRVLGEGAWVIIGQVATVLGTVGGTRLLTGQITPAMWGVVSLLIGVAAFVKNITVMPLANAGTRFYSDLELVGGVGLLRRVLERDLWWSWVAVALGLVVGLASAVFGYTSVWSVVLIVLLFVIDALRTMEITYLGAARRQRSLSLWNAGEACFRPAVAIAAVAAMGPSPGAVLAGYAVASGGLLAIYAYRTREAMAAAKATRAAAAADRAGPWTHETLRAAVWRYALPVIPAAIVAWVNGISDRYILAWLRGPDEVGVYVGAYGLVSIPFLMAQGVLTQTLRPVYLQALAAGNARTARRTFAVWLGATAAVMGAGFVGVVVLRHWIALILLAKAYRSGGEPLLPWIAAGYAIYAGGQTFAGYLQAHDRTRAWLAAEAAGAVVSIPLTMYMVHRAGALGAAQACPMYCAVIFVIQAVLSKTGGGRRHAPAAASPVTGAARGR